MLYYLIEGVKHLELPFEKTVCRHWKQKQYSLVNREESQEIRLPESMPDVGRVIASWGQVLIRGKDWRSSGVGINGGVMVWVLYAPDAGGPLQRIESWIPFQARVDFHDSAEDGVIRVESVLRSVDARNVSGRKLMLRVGVGLLVQTMIPSSVQICQGGELPPDVEQLSDHYRMMLTMEAGEKPFLLDEEISLPAGLPAVEKLVYFRMDPELEEQKVLGNKAVFRGVGKLHVLYQDDSGKLASFDTEVPFAQYMELDGEYEPEARISTVFCVTSLELDPMAEGGLRMKCGVVGQYLIDFPMMVEIVEDLYSPCREVEMVRENVDIPAWLDDRQEALDISEQIPADDGTVLDHLFCPDLPVMTRQSGGVSIDYGGTFYTLSQDVNGNCSGKYIRSSAQMQLPSECDTVCFQQIRGKSNCRKEGGNWRLDTQMVLDIRSIHAKPMEMVSGVKLGELRDPDPERPSVIIRRREPGQSLWNLAKSNGSTVGAIRRLNGLEEGTEDDRLLLIPVI